MEKKRLVFQLDTPYSTIAWPQVNLKDQDTLLELLCNLLSPLGEHRARHIQPSKGRREKKRKRKESGVTDSQPPVPAVPDVSSYVDVGLTTITRHLQKTATGTGSTPAEIKSDAAPVNDFSSSANYSVIFVARSGHPSILNSHLPQMVAVASEAHPSREPIRLVGLSKACEDRLSESLGIPRVSCLGLREGAPNSKPIVEFARQNVTAIQVPWLKEAQKAIHLDTKINTIQTTIGIKRQTKNS